MKLRVVLVEAGEPTTTKDTQMQTLDYQDHLF